MAIGFATQAQAILDLLPASNTSGRSMDGNTQQPQIIGLSIYRDQTTKVPQPYLTAYHPRTGFDRVNPPGSPPSWTRMGGSGPDYPFGIDDSDFDFAFFSDISLRVVCNVSVKVVLSAAAINFNKFFFRRVERPGRNRSGFTFKLEGDIHRHPYPNHLSSSADEVDNSSRGLVPVTAMGLPCPPHWDTMQYVLTSIDEKLLEEVGYDTPAGLRLLYMQWEKMMNPATLDAAPFAEVNLLHLERNILAGASEKNIEIVSRYADALQALRAGVQAKSTETVIDPALGKMLSELKSPHKSQGAAFNDFVETIQLQIQAAQ